MFRLGRTSADPAHAVPTHVLAPLNVALIIAALFAAAVATGTVVGVWLTLAAASAFALSGSA